MRLIDADAFKKYIIKGFEEMKSQFKTEFYLNIATRVTESFLEDIDEQPTVEAPPTSDDEIIKALKAVRTIHNGNYAPQIDEAIRRLTMQKSAYVQVNLSDERIQKAVAEAVEKMKAMIETQPTQPCEDCISRKAVSKIITKWLSNPYYELKDNIYDMTRKISKLPSVTPRTNLAETSQDCISILNRIMEYTHGMLTTEKIGLQHLIKSMMDELRGGDSE